MPLALGRVLGACGDAPQQHATWTLRFRDEGAERGFVRARGPSLASSACFALAGLCATCCFTVVVAGLELVPPTACLDVRRARIGLFGGVALLALVCILAMKTSLGLRILGAGAARLEIVLIMIGLFFVPLCVAAQYQYMARLVPCFPEHERLALHDDSQDCMMVLMMIMLQSVVHIILPIRWCVMWVLELTGVLCYTFVAIFWSTSDVRTRACYFVALFVEVIMLAVGKRNTERHERTIFTRVAQERTLRFQVEHQLDEVLREGGPPHAARQSKADDLASSIPGTTFTGELFQGLRWEDIVSLGCREHWLIPCADLQVRLDRVLGTGGFGMVLPGVYHGARVALKATKEPAKASSLMDIAQELRVFRLLRHPNIILFYGACVDATCSEMLLVLEYVDGVRLDDFVGEPPGAPDAAVRCKLAKDVACALRYLHAQDPSIVHGDIKGSNVLVQDQGANAMAKLVDFGLSRLVTKHAKPLGGTLVWVPPEIARKGRPAPSADVFSFGRLLYLIVTGRKPLAGVDRDRIVQHALAGRVHPLAWPDAAPLLEDCRHLCEACCQPEPKDRPSIAAVHATLQAWGTQQEEDNTEGSDSALFPEGSSEEEVVALEGNLQQLLERARLAVARLGPPPVGCVRRPADQPPGKPAALAHKGIGSSEEDTRCGTEEEVQSSVETSDPTSLALPHFAATPAATMELTVAATINTWNAPIRRRGACCTFHGVVSELERVQRKLAARPCKPGYLPHADWQCPRCKLMGLATSETTGAGTFLLRGECGACGHVEGVVLPSGPGRNVLIPL